MLSVSSLSVRSKFATVKISSDNLRSGLPGAAIPPTALLVDAIGLKVNEFDGAPEGAVGWFDGSSVVREIVGDTVGLSVASLASGDIDIDINILKKRFRGSTSCIDIGILKKRFRVSTSCSKRKNRIRNPKHNANGE